MNRSILVPLDGSSESEAILPEVQRIAGPRDHVHFLHVLSEAHSPSGFEATQAIALYEQGLRYLEVIRDRWLPAQPGGDFVRPGKAAQVILGLALEKNINLIAMTTHCRSGLGRFFLGSVASEVVSKAQLPVLLARPDQCRSSGAVGRILLAVEGSETPRDLLETVKSLTKGSKAEIILFHAVPVVADPAPQWAPASTLSFLADPERRLQEQSDLLEEEGYDSWPVVSHGDPAAEILNQARKLKVDLVALATHAREGLERLLAGSVAEAVLREAPVAVLLQKPLIVHHPALTGGAHG